MPFTPRQRGGGFVSRTAERKSLRGLQLSGRVHASRREAERPVHYAHQAFTAKRSPRKGEMSRATRLLGTIHFLQICFCQESVSIYAPQALHTTVAILPFITQMRKE